MDCIVTPAVLIPRPETEHVIETVLRLLGQVTPGSVDHQGTQGGQRGQQLSASPRIVDVGTGSGCIALALAQELPQAEIHATEISCAALEIARTNAARLQLEDRIHFHETDLLTGLGHDAFDFVVSNPPYVGESEQDEVQLEVRKFEPRRAVFAGARGTEVIEHLIPQAAAALKPDGWLVMEISGAIAEDVKCLLDGWEDVSITKDLQGIPRVAASRASGFTKNRFLPPEEPEE